jgi:hypothetical protein
VLEAVAHEVDGPHLIRRLRHLERPALHRHATPALAPNDLQLLLAVDALHALSVDDELLAAD